MDKDIGVLISLKTGRPIVPKKVPILPNKIPFFYKKKYFLARTRYISVRHNFRSTHASDGTTQLTNYFLHFLDRKWGLQVHNWVWTYISAPSHSRFNIHSMNLTQVNQYYSYSDIIPGQEIKLQFSSACKRVSSFITKTNYWSEHNIKNPIDVQWWVFISSW